MLRHPCEASDPVGSVLQAHAHGDDLLLRTSGTTARSGPVTRSTESWWASFPAYTERSGVERGARLWVPGPMNATMNLFAAVHADVVGAELVDHPGRATHACLTPALLARRRDDLRPGTRVVVGGDALSARQYAAARRLDVQHYYGAAELSFVAWGPHAGELRAFPGVDVEVVDGEIAVRSPFVAHPGSGALRMIDGWATVGDRGVLDGDRLRVLGRPGTIVTAGATVQLAEVEAALAPAAAGPYALLGVPHRDLGSVLAAVVTRAKDRERLAVLARTLPSSHRPRRWRVTDELPLTAGGKIDREALAELFWDAS